MGYEQAYHSRIKFDGTFIFDADNYRNVSRSRGYNAYKFSIAETETDLSKVLMQM